MTTATQLNSTNLTREITGILTGTFNNEKSDTIIVGDNRIILRKGESTDLSKLRGSLIKINAKETLNPATGTMSLWGDVKSIAVLEKAVTKPGGFSNHNKSSRYSQEEQESIAAQSMAKVAVEFTKYTVNMSTQQREDEFKRLLRTMYSLARIGMKPDLFRPNPTRNLDTTAKPDASNGMNTELSDSTQADEAYQIL